MTYLEKYGNFNNYQKVSSERALKELKNGLIYSNAACRIINVFNVPEKYLNKEDYEKKRAIEKAINYHKQIQNGGIIDQIYLAYWEKLQNEEFPTWRD